MSCYLWHKQTTTKLQLTNAANGNRNEVKIKKEMSTFDLSWILWFYGLTQRMDRVLCHRQKSKQERARECERERERRI